MSRAVKRGLVRIKTPLSARYMNEEEVALKRKTSLYNGDPLWGVEHDVLSLLTMIGEDPYI